jgi:hypothetical protein
MRSRVPLATYRLQFNSNCRCKACIPFETLLLACVAQKLPANSQMRPKNNAARRKQGFHHATKDPFRCIPRIIRTRKKPLTSASPTSRL